VGLEGFLLKPVNPSVLFDAITQVFGESEHEAVGDLREAAGKAPPPSLTDARVLVVEDNPINQQVAQEILEGAGIQVTLAANGREAVAAVNQADFDAVLMDVQMPVLDGYGATREIRRDARFRDLPIIAMTAHAMAGDEAKSLAAGMNGHVTKPIDPDQLFATLGRWIQTRRPPVPGTIAPQAATPEEDWPAALPGFDLDDGLKRLQGNRKLYRRLILDFGAKCANAGSAIRAALAAGNLEQAHHEVHSLKGAAGNLAAVDVQAAAQKIEGLVKGAKHIPAAEILGPPLAALDEALGVVASAVAGLHPFVVPAEAPSAAANGVTGIPAASRQALAARLREAAEIGDIGALGDMAAELQAQGGAGAALGARIARLADDFDLEGAAKLADGLA
jgi:CheY-like chemotaxis protein